MTTDGSSVRDDNQNDTASVARFTHPTGGGVLMLVAGLSAAWFSAGSSGLLGHPLGHAITWLALGVAIIAAWPENARSFRNWAILAGGAILALLFTASTLPAVNVLAVAVMLAAIAQVGRGLTGRLALIAALAATVLGCFRLAFASIPTVWLAADSAGWMLGRLAGRIGGNHLTVGATFGGIDFLVLTAAVYVAWVICTAPPRRSRALWAAAAIIIGQFVYLIAISQSEQLLARLPEPTVAPLTDINHVGVWTWGNGLRTLIPWNLPLLALLIQCAILAVMVRAAPWLPVVELHPKELERKKEREMKEEVPGSELALDMLFRFGPVLLAVAAALLAALAVNPSDLRGKKIVACRNAATDWARPQFDSQGEGEFAMLPLLVESLGGKFILSKDLSKQDLAEADVLLLVQPNQPWPKETLDRVWDYVRGGGSLLLAVGQASLPASDLPSNGVLEPLAIRVRPGTAVARTAGWEQSYDVPAHPATAGLDDLRNRFGVRSGASLGVRWPACPVLVGRWGWNESPSGNVDNVPLTPRVRDSRYAERDEYNLRHAERDEYKLGDLVLAAEQPWGAGRVVVLGDASPLHNEMLAGAYPFVGRLLGYLAHRPASPQAPWRQLLSVAAVIAMLALLSCRPAAWQVMLTGSVLAAALVCTSTAGYWSGRVLPDGHTRGPGGFNNVAYIDASHLESFGGQPDDRRADRGVSGLLRTLMRQGYLPLLASDLTQERLSRAGLLISIGPAREFSAAEREAIKKFVGGGGTMICLVGAEEARPSAPLLADFGFKVPPSPVPPGEKAREPEPLGAKFSQIAGQNRQYQFYAAWPVEETEPAKRSTRPTDESTDDSADEPTDEPRNKATSWVVWPDAKGDLPIVFSRPFGGGQMVVIGDTHFTSNENFGSDARSTPEIVHFWRWLLSRVVPGQKPWDPPPGSDNVGPAKGKAAGDEGDEEEDDGPDMEQPAERGQQ